MRKKAFRPAKTSDAGDAVGIGRPEVWALQTSSLVPRVSTEQSLSAPGRGPTGRPQRGASQGESRWTIYWNPQPFVLRPRPRRARTHGYLVWTAGCCDWLIAFQPTALISCFIRTGDSPRGVGNEWIIGAIYRKHSCGPPPLYFSGSY